MAWFRSDVLLVSEAGTGYVHGKREEEAIFAPHGKSMALPILLLKVKVALLSQGRSTVPEREAEVERTEKAPAFHHGSSASMTQSLNNCSYATCVAPLPIEQLLAVVQGSTSLLAIRHSAAPLCFDSA